ncbi:MAG TPA: mechanosensitive ion channel family protein [Marmoricola sp.]|nr:mechanosensitive ion channel family protein [Marmoricola sp.]
MLPLTTRFDDVTHWLRGSGLEIVLIVVGAVLLHRLINWTRVRYVAGLDERGAAGRVVQSEEAKYHRALAQVLLWVLIVLIYVIAAFLVVLRLGIPVTGFVAPATVIGVALGFGAQRIVQDLLAGFFVVAERQYGYGDLVKVAVIGVPEPVIGTVEAVSLRVTRIRATNGEVVVTPNGEIVQVTNYSRDWARAVLDVPVPVQLDVNQVSAVLQQVGEEAFADDALRPLLLDAPAVMGVESIDVEELKIRVVARTQPGRQFEVGRALRARIAAAFRREGITVPPTLATSGPTAAHDE